VVSLPLIPPVSIDDVGIGTDFDGPSEMPVAPEMSQLVILIRRMHEHKLTEDKIYKIWGGNYLRVMKQAIDTG